MNPYLKIAYNYGARHAQVQFEKRAQQVRQLTGAMTPEGKALTSTRAMTPEERALLLRSKGLNMRPRQAQQVRQLTGAMTPEGKALTSTRAMTPEERARLLRGTGLSFTPGWEQRLKAGSHEKHALDIGDVLAPAAGAIPLAGPAVAGTTGGIEVGPGFGRHVGQRTALEAMKGQTIGGLGGAAIGGGLGAAAPWLGEQLDIEALEDLDPKRSALIGALLGGGLGAGIGGGIGAARGRSAGKQEVGQTEDILRAQQQAALQQRIQQALQQAYQRGGTEQSQLSQLMGY